MTRKHHSNRLHETKQVARSRCSPSAQKYNQENLTIYINEFAKRPEKMRYTLLLSESIHKTHDINDGSSYNSRPILHHFNSFNMKNINDFLKRQVDSHNTPSIQYAFFDAHNTIFELQYGLKNIRSQEPVDSSTTYNLFSVTKTFTALAVLQLAQAGKVQLNRPVLQYLPEFPYNSQITVEQLLSHTSGIPNPIPLKWIHLEDEHRNFDHEKFFGEIFRIHYKNDFEPGLDFKYSNLGYELLGQLIEKVSGQSFEEFTTRNLLEKAGIEEKELGFTIDPRMHATGYHKWFSITNAVLGFLIDKRKFMGEPQGKWQPFNNFYNNGRAYGGLIGSVKGLTKYAQALLRQDAVLLSDEYKKILLTEKVIKNKSIGMSFSWFTGTLKGNRYFAHAGGGGGYYVELRLYPELQLGNVIMYNRSGMKDERILSKADSFNIRPLLRHRHSDKHLLDFM